MHEAEFHEHVGEENICASIADAIERAKSLYPELSQQYPAGTTWGRRSTDVPLPKPAFGAATSAALQGREPFK